MAGKTFICGPADAGCWVYGTKVADRHRWRGNVNVERVREHGTGPLCLTCGLPLGTAQAEQESGV